MTTTTKETIRLAYQLPAEPHNNLGGWQPSDDTRFPDDRATQDQRNRAELFANSGIRRRVA